MSKKVLDGARIAGVEEGGGMRLTSIKDVITDKISGEWGDEALNGEGVGVIRTANFLNSGKINFSNLVRRGISQKKVEKKKLISGDIIIEKSGGSPTQPVGRVVFFENPDGDTYLCNNFTTILRPKKKEVHPEFLFLVLHSNHKKGKTLRYQNKTTGIINLKLDSYLDSEIYLPPLNEQIRIAHLLGKVEGLIAQRKQHLKQLDDLLKSVFLEMFGDPVRNEKGWSTEPFSQIGKFTSGGTPSKSRDDFWVGEYPWVSPKDMKVPKIFDSEDHISAKVFDETALKRIAPGHLLIVVRGMILAHSFPVAINMVDVAINQDMKAIKLKSNLRTAYVFHCLIALKRQILKLITTAGHGTKKFDSDVMVKLLIPIPPPGMQDQFFLIADKIEQTKSYYQQSLTDLESLYGVLSQQAFKGELDLSFILPAEQLTQHNNPKYDIFVSEEKFQGLNNENSHLLATAEGRIELLRHLLEKEMDDLHPDGEFDLDIFWTCVLGDSNRFMDEENDSFGTAEYEQLKNWIFELLDEGRLVQRHEKKGRLGIYRSAG